MVLHEQIAGENTEKREWGKLWLALFFFFWQNWSLNSGPRDARHLSHTSSPMDGIFK
jgi:hypothetical protein